MLRANQQEIQAEGWDKNGMFSEPQASVARAMTLMTPRKADWVPMLADTPFVMGDPYTWQAAASHLQLGAYCLCKHYLSLHLEVISTFKKALADYLAPALAPLWGTQGGCGGRGGDDVV